MKKALLEARPDARRTAHEERAAAVHARIEARRAEHEQKLNDIRARIEERKAKRHQLKAADDRVKAEPAQKDRNAELIALKAERMAKVPKIHFPDDPKYNTAQKYE